MLVLAAMMIGTFAFGSAGAVHGRAGLRQRPELLRAAFDGCGGRGRSRVPPAHAGASLPQLSDMEERTGLFPCGAPGHGVLRGLVCG